MARAFVAFGSNIDPAVNIREAVRLLARRVHVVAVSTVYRTAPEERPDQPYYYNCVTEIETPLQPVELKRDVLRRIEAELCRERSGDRYAPRTIDLDLILYDDIALETEDVVVPDPEIARRSFLALALYELDPGLSLPGSGTPVKELALRFRGQEMDPLREYTGLVRKEIVHGSEHQEDDGAGQAAACRDRRRP